MDIIKHFFAEHYPHYANLSVDAQERFRIDHLDKLNDQFKVYFQSNVIQFDFKNEEEEGDYYDQHPEITLLYNGLTTQLRGVGENSFYLNEFLADDKDILSYRTLFDYDYEDHVFQEMAHIETRLDHPCPDTPEPTEQDMMEISPYRMRLNANWARCWLKGEGKPKFYYILLNSLIYEIESVVEDHMSDLIDKLIPNELIPGPNHGKRSRNDMVRWNMVWDAKGREKELDAMKKSMWGYQRRLFSELAVRFDESPQSKIWLLQDEHEEESKTFIASDKYVLQKVEIKRFEESIQPYLADKAELDAMIEAERQKGEAFIRARYNELIGQ